MKSPPPPSLLILQEFLRRRGWALLRREGRLEAWEAPESLGMPKGYNLHLPSSDETSGGTQQVLRVAAILTDLYELSLADLQAHGDGKHGVLSIRLQGADFEGGTVPFLSFEGMVDRLKQTLLDAAAFALTETPTVIEVPDEARQYLAQCRFLQTESGSFVARVQLPSATPLVEATLFAAELSGSAVGERLVDSLSFISDRVFRDDRSIYTEEGIEEEAPRINVDLFRDIGELLSRSKAASVSISLTTPTGSTTVESGPLSPERFERLSAFVAFARNRLSADMEIDVVGRIVELRSRRPDRSRNHVGITAMLGGREIYISLSVGRQDYPSAVMAHNRNRPVHLVASVREMKTQFRVIRLSILEEIQVDQDSPRPNSE